MKLSSLLLACGAGMMLTTAVAAKEPDKVDARGEKLICRRDAEIGSLIPRKKRCYTKAEWDKISLAARENATRLVQDGTTRSVGQ